MASYTKEQIDAANLPVAEMRDRLNPKTHPKHQSRFFNHALRIGLAAQNKVLSDHEIDQQSGNIAYSFKNYADGKETNLRTGLNCTIQDLLTAWAALKNGTINLDTPIPTSGDGPTNGTNGNGTKPTSTPATPAAATSAPVPPVSQNVFASALKVFDGLRTSDPTFPVPSNADDAYGLLWDNLAEPVKAGRASGVISDTLANLVATNRDLFNGIITVLPDDVKDALEEVLMERAFDTYRTSLKTTVENVYHISVGAKHAARYFNAWASQVAEIANWNGRDEPLGWRPNEDQMREANRNHAVTAFRNLATGLRNEVAASQPAPVQTEVLQPIQFNTIMARLLQKGPEMMAEVGGRWGSMTPQAQHEFVANLDAEDAAAKAAADAPKVETKPEPKTPAKPATGGSQPKV